MSTYNNYQGNNKSEKKDVSVNSRGIQLYNAESTIEPSTLVLGAWNDYFTIRIHPALPADKRSATSVYDYEHHLTVVLNFDRCVLLQERIITDLIPAIKENRDHSVGVVLPRKQGEGESLVSVAYKAETQDIVLTIYKSLDDNSLKPKEMISYHMNKVVGVSNYDHESGQFDVKDNYQGDFLAFLKVLDVAVKDLIQINGHGGRVSTRFKDDRADRANRKTLGETYNNSNSYGNSGYSNNKSSFSNRNQETQDNNTGASTEHLNHADQINNFLS